MKVLVCGGRDFADAEAMNRVLSDIKPSMIIHAGLKGAAWLADCWARQHGIPQRRHIANGLRYGSTAGVLNNQWMLQKERPDLVVAFPGDAITADMVARAKAAGIPVREQGHDR